MQVLDSGINLSDHCPLTITVSVPDFTDSAPHNQKSNTKSKVEQLNFLWDHCDITQYYLLTTDYLALPSRRISAL